MFNSAQKSSMMIAAHMLGKAITTELGGHYSVNLSFAMHYVNLMVKMLSSRSKAYNAVEAKTNVEVLLRKAGSVRKIPSTDELVANTVKVVPTATSTADKISDIMMRVINRQIKLTAWESEFMDSMASKTNYRNPTFSDKQAAVVDRIYAK